MSDTRPPEAQPDPIEELIDFLSPAVIDILRRLDADEFTTIDFIEVLKTDPTANAAYEEAVRLWGEQDRYSRMVVHGQVIPLILRRSGLVDWVGFAHDQADDYAVPAWWRLRTGQEAADSSFS